MNKNTQLKLLSYGMTLIFILDIIGLIYMFQCGACNDLHNSPSISDDDNFSESNPVPAL